MLRFFFVVLAIVAAVLAALFDLTWMYVVAGALLVVAGMMLLVQARDQYRRRERTTPRRATSIQDRGDDLRAYGIMEVREKTEDPINDLSWGDAAQRAEQAADEPAEETTDEYAPPDDEELLSAVEAATESAAASAEEEMDGPEEVHADAGRVTAFEESEAEVRPDPLSFKDEETVEDHAEEEEAPAVPLGQTVSKARPRSSMSVNHAHSPEDDAYLKSIKRTIHAHTIGLLRIDHDAKAYVVQSLESDSDRTSRRGATFAFRDHFLSELIPQITVIEIGEEIKREELTYYKAPPPVEHLLVAPVYQGSELAAFLVADRLAPSAGFTEDEIYVFREAAYLLGHMRGLRQGDSINERWTPKPFPVRKLSVHHVIKEEIAESRERERPLALALVFLNAVESLSEKSKDGIEAAEGRMSSRLKKIVRKGRLEHFGELGFGVFLYTGPEELERWIERAHDAFDEPDPILEGDLMIGAAMLSDKHVEPEDLQLDAAAALQEAYATGESTILVA